MDGLIYAIGGAIKPLPIVVPTGVVEQYDSAQSPAVQPGDKWITTWGVIRQSK